MAGRMAPPLSIVKRHKTMLAAAKTASTSNVTPRKHVSEPMFRTVLAPNPNWPPLQLARSGGSTLPLSS
jgi:hypothetical protein